MSTFSNEPLLNKEQLDVLTSLSEDDPKAFLADLFNTFHPNTQQYRFSDSQNPGGPSVHISQPLGVTIGLGAGGYTMGGQTYPSASEEPFHVDEHGSFMGYVGDVWETVTK